MTALNAAGRRYILTDPCSKARGVSVLQKIVDSIDCLFTHLRENPGLCSYS